MFSFSDKIYRILNNLIQSFFLEVVGSGEEYNPAPVRILMIKTVLSGSLTITISDLDPGWEPQKKS
jgi:hypothetical protein